MVAVADTVAIAARVFPAQRKSQVLFMLAQKEQLGAMKRTKLIAIVAIVAIAVISLRKRESDVDDEAVTE